MELTFVKNEKAGSYVAEFEATADFNLHIEREKGGDILLYQRTQGGGWDIVDDFGVQRHQGVIDYDCTALVYPKYLKIVSEVEPTYAAIVSDGEVTEIKSQSKEIEVTANGTTEVTPDAGFAYLNKVSVKTNVPQSGGGGSSASEWRYVDLRQVTGQMQTYILNYGHMVNITVQGTNLIGSTIIATVMPDTTINAMAVNMGGYIQDSSTGFKPIMLKDIFAQEQDGVNAWDGLLAQIGATEITEVEFFSIAS